MPEEGDADEACLAHIQQAASPRLTLVFLLAIGEFTRASVSAFAHWAYHLKEEDGKRH